MGAECNTSEERWHIPRMMARCNCSDERWLALDDELVHVTRLLRPMSLEAGPLMDLVRQAHCKPERLPAQGTRRPSFLHPPCSNTGHVLAVPPCKVVWKCIHTYLLPANHFCRSFWLSLGRIPPARRISSRWPFSPSHVHSLTQACHPARFATPF